MQWYSRETAQVEKSTAAREIEVKGKYYVWVDNRFYWFDFSLLWKKLAPFICY